jgi:chromodomain-helicase-DNA-binding protein 4
MNCVVFHGSAAARKLIVKNEWHYMQGGNKVSGCFKFDVIITTYEMILVGRVLFFFFLCADEIFTYSLSPLRHPSQTESRLLARVNWECMIIDEGHRIKNKQSKLFEQLRNFKTKHRVVLTGTPLQNHMQELWWVPCFCYPFSSFALA